VKHSLPTRRAGRIAALVTAVTLLAAPLAAAPAASAAPAPTAVHSISVVAAAKLSSSKPSISGTARVGTRLAVKKGSWKSGTKFSYVWRVAGKKVGTGTKYTPRASQVGKKIAVSVTGKKSGYKTVTRTSSSKKIGRGVFSAPTPRISGSAKVGSTLTAAPGAWKPGAGTLRYQWRADGSTISGATSKTFRPTTSQVGKKITVKVTGSKAGYTTVSRTSASTAKVVVPAPIPGNGTYKVGSAVKAGTYVGRGGSSCYWERRSTAGSSFDGIIANGFYASGQVIVTIAAGDKYFLTDGCGSWVSLAASGSPKKSSVGDGVYSVGQHMAAGTYRTSGGEGCYYEVLSGFSGEFGDIEENEFTPEKMSLYATVANGQGFATSDCGTWVRQS